MKMEDQRVEVIEGFLGWTWKTNIGGNEVNSQEIFSTEAECEKSLRDHIKSVSKAREVTVKTTRWETTTARPAVLIDEEE